MNYTSRRPAEVAKLVDAPDSKCGGGNPVRVRVSLSAPNTWYYQSIGSPVRITRYWQYNQATSSPSNGFLLIYRCKPFATANPLWKNVLATLIRRFYLCAAGNVYTRPIE